VDKSAYHNFMPAYPWVAFGMREPEQVRRPLANLEKRGITYLQATVEALDPANNRVKTSAGGFPMTTSSFPWGPRPCPLLPRTATHPGASRGP
ncbi:MAG: hypothetical protein P3W93_001330, partial [Thermus sp.]|nr:hypothetical protein [Thermus sp.]